MCTHRAHRDDRGRCGAHFCEEEGMYTPHRLMIFGETGGSSACPREGLPSTTLLSRVATDPSRNSFSRLLFLFAAIAVTHRRRFSALRAKAECGARDVPSGGEEKRGMVRAMLRPWTCSRSTGTEVCARRCSAGQMRTTAQRQATGSCCAFPRVFGRRVLLPTVVAREPGARCVGGEVRQARAIYGTAGDQSPRPSARGLECAAGEDSRARGFTGGMYHPPPPSRLYSADRVRRRGVILNANG
ncbi:hypothetical protein C8R47DRAFT_1159464 [Mycena vitilis]|nr:hypothetical protein C8R47DRAFT_1159464 [Mycena vitilis]